MEIENKLSVKDVISNNLELLHKLDLIGVKSISSAIDLMHVYNTFKQYSWIDSKQEQKKVTASQCKVSVSYVEKSIALMNKEIRTKNKNPAFK